MVPESAAWLFDFFEGNFLALLLVGVLVADVCVEVLLDTKVLRAELAGKVVSFQMLLIKMLPKLALRQKLELTAWCAAVITLLLLMQLEMLLERRLLNEHLLTTLELAAIRFLPSLEIRNLHGAGDESATCPSCCTFSRNLRIRRHRVSLLCVCAHAYTGDPSF